MSDKKREPLSGTYETSTFREMIFFESQVRELEAYTTQLEEKLKIYENALKDIRDNYDCDEDAHKYNTTCRCCLADEALKEINGNSNEKT